MSDWGDDFEDEEDVDGPIAIFRKALLNVVVVLIGGAILAWLIIALLR